MSAKAVLYVEDEENDVFFLKNALETLHRSEPLFVCRDGQEAIDFLARHRLNAAAETDLLLSLMILDIKLPKKNGFDVLTWVRGQAALRELPVIMFSGSNHRSDVQRSYSLGANAFLVKPTTTRAMADLVHITYEFWLTQNEGFCEIGINDQQSHSGLRESMRHPARLRD